MSSRQGFPRADVDTGYFHDSKAIALARRQRDPIRTLATLGLHLAAVLASWNEARPMTIDDAAPAWFLEDLDAFRSDLAAVGLVDQDGRITERAFVAWVGRIVEVREAASLAGREGNRRRWHPDDPPIATPSGPDRDPMGEPQPPDRPTYLSTGRPVLPTDRPAGSATSRPRAGAAGDAAPRNGHADPPCFVDPTRELYRLHACEHYVAGAGQNRCHACERLATAAV